MSAPCGFGGFCARTPGHDGAHTARPMVSTRRFDEDRERARAKLVMLAALDFPTPGWADLLDGERS